MPKRAPLVARIRPAAVLAGTLLALTPRSSRGEEPAPAAPEPAPPSPSAPPAQPSPVFTAAPPPVTVEPPPAGAEPPGVHEHDGFYLRLAIGFSGYNDLLLSKETDTTPSSRVALSGIATASEVAVGGTTKGGVTLGVGFYNVSVLTSSRTVEKGTDIPPELNRPAGFSLLGFFGDWYFRPHRGLHGQAALGFAALSRFQPDSTRLRDRSFAWGGGLMLGVGNEWWIDDQWSIGLLARVTTGLTTEKDDSGRRWFHLISATPGLMFSATYQ